MNLESDPSNQAEEMPETKDSAQPVPLAPTSDLIVAGVIGFGAIAGIYTALVASGWGIYKLFSWPSRPIPTRIRKGGE